MTSNFFFFFFQLYNSLWVLACSIISFHCFLSCVLCFQLVTPIFLKSFLTSSSHLTLGLPFSLVAYGFHLYMVLATLSLVILSTCPNQLSRLYFMYLTIFSLSIASSNSSFVLSLHSQFAFCVGPNILLNIFLSNTNNFCLMFSVKTQNSDPYTKDISGDTKIDLIIIRFLIFSSFQGCRITEIFFKGAHFW